MKNELNYNVIQTGSKGNALIIENKILLDCGVSFKKIKPYLKNLQLVFISHEHQDHLNKTCVKKLAEEKPNLRFAVGNWLVKDLVECGVNPKNIDILIADLEHKYKICSIIPFKLYHDIKNFGIKLYINDFKIIFATDTNRIDHVDAKNFTHFFLESNYREKTIQAKIREKELRGQYIYERRVLDTHLSDEKCNEFFWKNSNIQSKIIKLHRSSNNW